MSGRPLPPLDKPRWTPAHVVRWMAAQQNWDRIHFDQAFCRDTARLPAPVINGALKQHLIAQFLGRAYPGGWPWRIDFRFRAPDYVGQRLQVRGAEAARTLHDGHWFVEVTLEIANLDQGQATTEGRAVVVLREDGQAVLNALDLQAPAGFALPRDVAADDAAGPEFAARLGQVLDERASKYPLDLSRLRLFADAVMDLDPVHHDPEAPSPWGAVVAPPLFPLHGLEAAPGSHALSEAPDAQGREGVNEVGRDLAPLFGLSAAGGMNAGNRVQVHALARVGERIRARSQLVGARRRTGARGGEMVFFETLNDYETTQGRALLTERQTVVVRLVGG